MFSEWLFFICDFKFIIPLLNKILFYLLGKELDDKIKTYFISGAYKSAFLQGAIALLTILTSLFIARATGDKGFGVYTTVFTWISIISVGATLGLDDLLLKKLPVYSLNNSFSKIKGILSWSNLLGLGFGLFCAALFLLLVNFTSIHGLYEYKQYYFWAAWVIPFFVLMHVNQAALRGLKFLGWGQFAEKLVQPFAFFAFLILAFFLQNFFLTDEHADILL